ncbi:hypothetical protein CHS0354_009164, partial [Potamilus streckersoni]
TSVLWSVMHKIPCAVMGGPFSEVRPSDGPCAVVGGLFSEVRPLDGPCAVMGGIHSL